MDTYGERRIPHMKLKKKNSELKKRDFLNFFSEKRGSNMNQAANGDVVDRLLLCGVTFGTSGSPLWCPVELTLLSQLVSMMWIDDGTSAFVK